MNEPALSVTKPDRPVRVKSIDALRGFDMFWIMGGDVVTRTYLQTAHPLKEGSLAHTIDQQLEHCVWEGFRFYDLIFPLFLFLVGCVLPYSLAKYRDQPKQVYVRIFRRGAMLVFLGLVINGFFRLEFADLRYAGVLQRIGICYVAAALLFLHTQIRGQVIAIVSILLGYWAILAWVPVPGGAAGDLTAAGNLSGYLDRTILPGKIYEAYYGFGDNEGILSTLPAVATVLLGVLAGHGLRSRFLPWHKVAGLAVAGLILLLIGYSWAPWFPIIKNLWTSSFVLVAGGYSLLLLALFYAMIDVLKYERWAFFWVVIGCNAITIYVANRIIDFGGIASFFVGGIATRSGLWSALILITATVLVRWLFLWFLYRKNTFLRV